MSATPPPSLPGRDAAFKTYLRAIVYLLTAAFFIFFSSLFLVPKIEQIWQKVGRRDVPLGTVITAIDFLKSNAHLLLLGLVAAAGMLEWKASWWRRHRGLFVELIVYAVVVTTLAMFAATATTALVLAPLLNRP